MKKTSFSESIVVESKLPIKRLLALEIIQQLNDHGRLKMRVVIENDKQQDFLKRHEVGGQVNVYDTRQHPQAFLFCGKVTTILCEQQADLLLADIHIACFTLDLDQSKRIQTFQNPKATFEEVVKQSIQGQKSNFLTHVIDRKTNQPFIQYEETDWEFITRLASHFNQPIHGSLFADYPVFHFGMRKGWKRTLDESKIMEYGFSKAYYNQGGYVGEKAHEDYRYLKIKHHQAWEMGDYVYFEKKKFTVIERLMIFDELGELYYIDTLGAEGLIYQPTIYNDELIGVQLEGTVQDTEHESVAISFSFDGFDENNHLWEWKPEVGNWVYLMPEIGSRIVLTLPTNDEKDGIATHILRRNGSYPSEDHRGLSTPHNKHLRLYPNQIELEVDASNVSMAEEQGIRINSANGINLNAQGAINFNGEQIFVQAPERILMQTSESNIELCKNFNIYAPNGVTNYGTDGDGGEVEDETATKASKVMKEDDPNHWQASYSALGAISSTNLNAIDNDLIIRLRALGSVPKILGIRETIAMSEVMKGVAVEETTFPDAIENMSSYTFNCGYYIKGEKVRD